MYTAFPLTPESRKDLLWPCSLGGASGVFTCLSGAGGRAGRVRGFRATGGGARTAGAAAAAHAGAHAGRLRRAAGHRRHPGCAFPPADKRSDMPHTAPHRCAKSPLRDKSYGWVIGQSVGHLSIPSEGLWCPVSSLASCCQTVCINVADGAPMH